MLGSPAVRSALPAQDTTVTAMFRAAVKLDEADEHSGAGSWEGKSGGFRGRGFRTPGRVLGRDANQPYDCILEVDMLHTNKRARVLEVSNGNVRQSGPARPGSSELAATKTPRGVSRPLFQLN